MRKISSIVFLFVGLSTALFAQKTVKVGDYLPNVALLSTKGSVYSLNDQKSAKGFIMVFMTPTCDHCIAYEGRVMALDKKYKAKGFPVVAIGPYGDEPISYPLDAMPEMKKLATSKGFTFPYLSDNAFKYTFLLNIRTTPTAVVLQKTSKGYLIKYIGSIDDQLNPNKIPTQKFVEQQVNKML